MHDAGCREQGSKGSEGGTGGRRQEEGQAREDGKEERKHIHMVHVLAYVCACIREDGKEGRKHIHMVHVHAYVCACIRENGKGARRPGRQGAGCRAQDTKEAGRGHMA